MIVILIFIQGEELEDLLDPECEEEFAKLRKLNTVSILLIIDGWTNRGIDR